jgi:hypothetical protein
MAFPPSGNPPGGWGSPPGGGFGGQPFGTPGGTPPPGGGFGPPPGGGFGPPPGGGFGPPGGGGFGPPPQQQEPGSSSDYMAQIIVSFVTGVMGFFCCGIFGVVPIIFAVVALSNSSSGKHIQAKKWANYGAISGVVMFLLGFLLIAAYIVFVVVLGATQSSYGGY